MHRLVPPIAVAVVAIAAAGWHLQTAAAPLITHGVVVRVVDGDTIDVSGGGRTEDVRLLGMDTPETVDPRKPVGRPGSKVVAATCPGGRDPGPLQPPGARD
jgi:endonuclease YncB( thermonuclease family)